MKDFLTATFILLSGLLLSALPFLPAGAAASPYYTGAAAQPSAGPTEEINDDFARANSDTLGGDWTEQLGDTDISSETAVPGAVGADAENVNLQLSSANGYIKVDLTWGNDNAEYIWMIFRADADLDPRYWVSFSANEDDVAFSATGDGELASSAMTINAGTESYGITWTGSGTDLVVKVWQGVTADAPTDADTWDAGAADVTFTADPTTPLDSSFYVGFGTFDSDQDTAVDNFIAGTL